MDEFDEIKKDFLVEARDLLAGTERCFLNLEKNCEDPENLNQLFRLAHNLKGTSKAVGFEDLSDFTHRLESLLLCLKQKQIHTTAPILDLLLRCNDYLVTTIESLQNDLNATYANAELSDELVKAMEPGYGIDNQGASVESPIVNDNNTPLIVATSTPAAATAAKSKDENIRVSLARIEKLLNNVGELSILQAVMVEQSLERGTQIPMLMRETLSAMSKIIKETQSISMGLRMLPIKQTFQKMERIVRDTSKALNKEVQLTLIGEETEIDKTVLEQIADPLVHIIRNAVDHGLETTEERMVCGKPTTGEVTLAAFHSAGHMVIEIRDDGKGLDAQKLITKAKSKNLIAEDAQLTDQQAYDLIFAPGFSTKETVTDVSGRGVGMDVVRTNIAALQGSVAIETSLGKGTCFRIYLPLTLAIIDSVVVRIARERYVIPLSQVSEFFRPQETEMTYVYGRSELLTLREETLPAFRLAGLIKRDQEIKPAWQLTSLIVRNNSKACAVFVDQIISQQQVVIKPLGSEVKNKPGFMGSAILGDGKPALILDLFELTKTLTSPASLQQNMEAS